MKNRCLVTNIAGLLFCCCLLGSCVEPSSGIVDLGAAPTQLPPEPRATEPAPLAPGAPTPAHAAERLEPPPPPPSEAMQPVAVYRLARPAETLHLVRSVVGRPLSEQVEIAAMEQLIGGAMLAGTWTPYPTRTSIRSVEVLEGTATVDFSAQVLEARVDAENELLGIQAAVWTLTELPGIERVRFTVEGNDEGLASNGRRIEDWWGHIGLGGQPFVRDPTVVVRDDLEP